MHTRKTGPRPERLRLELCKLAALILHFGETDPVLDNQNALNNNEEAEQWRRWLSFSQIGSKLHETFPAPEDRKPVWKRYGLPMKQFLLRFPRTFLVDEAHGRVCVNCDLSSLLSIAAAASSSSSALPPSSSPSGSLSSTTYSPDSSASTRAVLQLLEHVHIMDDLRSICHKWNKTEEAHASLLRYSHLMKVPHLRYARLPFRYEVVCTSSPQVCDEWILRHVYQGEPPSLSVSASLMEPTKKDEERMEANINEREEQRRGTMQSHLMKYWKKGKRVVGFDVEMASPLGSLKQRIIPALLQLATDRSCLLVQLLWMADFPPLLRQCLVDPFILKVGVRVKNDEEMLQCVHQYRPCHYLQAETGQDNNNAANDTSDLKLKGLLELHEMAKQLGYCPTIQQKTALFGLKELAARFLHLYMKEKDNRWLRASQWDAAKLCPAQQIYAAMDAWISREIFMKLLEVACHDTKPPSFALDVLYNSTNDEP
ncbi:3'-5' exonuclease domain-containing protein 2 [Balamuthia mandrillaris]